MNGCQLATSMYCAPNAMNSRMTVTLIATTTELTNADWVMPT